MQYPLAVLLGENNTLQLIHTAGIAMPSARNDREDSHHEARSPLVIARHRVPKQSQGQAHESGQYQSIMTKKQKPPPL